MISQGSTVSQLDAPFSHATSRWHAAGFPEAGDEVPWRCSSLPFGFRDGGLLSRLRPAGLSTPLYCIPFCLPFPINEGLYCCCFVAPFRPRHQSTGSTQVHLSSRRAASGSTLDLLCLRCCCTAGTSAVHPVLLCVETCHFHRFLEELQCPGVLKVPFLLPPSVHRLHRFANRWSSRVSFAVLISLSHRSTGPPAPLRLSISTTDPCQKRSFFLLPKRNSTYSS